MEFFVAADPLRVTLVQPANSKAGTGGNKRANGKLTIISLAILHAFEVIPSDGMLMCSDVAVLKL